MDCKEVDTLSQRLKEVVSGWADENRDALCGRNLTDYERGLCKGYAAGLGAALVQDAKAPGPPESIETLLRKIEDLSRKSGAGFLLGLLSDGGYRIEVFRGRDESPPQVRVIDGPDLADTIRAAINAVKEFTIKAAFAEPFEQWDI